MASNEQNVCLFIAPQLTAPVPLQVYAEEHNLPFQTITKDSLNTIDLENKDIDLLIAVSFGLFIPSRIIKEVGSTINVHPSLLPEFPGAHAVDDALTAGVKTTGVTVHYVDEGLDTGTVIRQEPVAVEPRDTLLERIHAVEHRLLPEVVRQLCAH